MRSPDVPLDATSETSEGARRRPRGILPASYTCQTFEFDAAIAWGGFGVGLGIATTKAGVGVAVGLEAGRGGVALRASGVGDTEAKSGVAEGTEIGVASGVGDTVARSGVLAGMGIGVAIGVGLGVGVASLAASGFSTRMRS